MPKRPLSGRITCSIPNLFSISSPRMPRYRRACGQRSTNGVCLRMSLPTQTWPNQLYIREGRRLVGEYVMRQADLQTERTKPDSIGMGSYNSDSHNIQRIAMPDGTVQNEGDVQVSVEPYAIA